MHSYCIQETQSLSCFGVKHADLIKKIQSRFPMAFYQKIVPSVMKANVQNIEAARREKNLIHSEFKRFSDLSDHTIHRALMQLDFENLLETKFGVKLELDPYCWIENFDQSSFTQVLQNAKTSNSEIYTKFNAREGSLLLLIANQGAPTCFKKDSVKEFAVKSKVGFGLFNKLIEKENHLLNPNQSDNSTVYASGDRLLVFQENVKSAYPSDGAKFALRNLSTRTESSSNFY
jgi:hypothetical protein